jgi:hypothetical protein
LRSYEGKISCESFEELASRLCGTVALNRAWLHFVQKLQPFWIELGSEPRGSGRVLSLIASGMLACAMPLHALMLAGFRPKWPDLKPTVAGFVGLCSVLHRLAPQRFAINAPSRSVSGECQCIPLPSAEPPRTDCARREQLRQAPYQRRCRTWEVRDTLLLAAGERRISLRSEMMPESLLAAPVSVPGCEFRDAYLSRYLVASRGAS